MAEFRIKVNNTREAEQTLNTVERMLGAGASDVYSCMNTLSFEVKGRADIERRLKNAAERLSVQQKNVGGIRSSLDEIINDYIRTEQIVCGAIKPIEKAPEIGAAGSAGENTGQNDPQNSPQFEWAKLIKDEIKNVMGPFAFSVGTLDIIQGKDFAIAKYLNSVVKGMGKAISSSNGIEVDWSKLFGLDPSKSTSFKDAFLKKLGDFSNVNKGIGTVVKWGTAVVSSGIENLQEFGANAWTNNRFWREVGVESALKIGEAALITAGITAVAAGLPGIVIGGATAAAMIAVDWGLNNVVSWLTGGAETKWVEAVSDFVNNTGEMIVEGVGKAVSKTVDVVKDVGSKAVQAVGEGFNKVTEAVGNFFSGCRWGSSLFAW